MIDHVGLRTADFDRLKDFYTQALKPLGITVQMEFPGVAGFGRAGQPAFWLGPATAAGATSSVHLAFQAASREQVDAFHRAALSAGATDNGSPGLRTEYHPNYYAGFVLDPDGNNIEAVCHQG